MTSKELKARLSEIQAALLCSFGKPEGLTEEARKNALLLVGQLKREIQQS